MPENENIENTENVETIENNDTIENIETVETPTESTEPAKKKGGGFLKFRDSILGTTVILGGITAITVFVLSAIHSLTAPIIEKRLQSEKQESIVELFGEGTVLEYADFDFESPVVDAAYVKELSSDKLIGYFVTVAPKGFGGEILMLVAVNTNITVKNIKILEMSETAGIGTKIESESWFAEQFRFKTKNIAAGKTGQNTVDVISGATKSSKAVISGTNAALEAAEKIRVGPTDSDKTDEIEEEVEVDEMDEVDEVDEGEETEETGEEVIFDE